MTTPAAPELPPGYRDGRMFSDAESPTVLRTGFDVAEYTRTAQGRLEVDAAAVAEEELGGATRADLAFLWRLDHAALSETRALLATSTANEARITAFIATWGYERYWLAAAVRDLLRADGSVPGPGPRRGLLASMRGAYVEKLLPVISPVWTTLVGEAVTAGQMARMSIQEGSLQAAYRAIRERVPAGGEASRVLSSVIARRDRMIDFFRTEATARIRRSPAEAAAARLHLRPSWSPLRIVGVADGDESRALPSIFRTAASRAELFAADAAIRDVIPSRIPLVARILTSSAGRPTGRLRPGTGSSLIVRSPRGL